MAIKFGMKLPEIFAQLVRGYRKVTGRNPEGLDLIKIRQESLRRFQDMNKVVDMQTGKSIDASKPIVGGSQEFASGIMKAMKTKPREVKTEDTIKKKLEKQNKERVDKLVAQNSESQTLKDFDSDNDDDDTSHNGKIRTGLYRFIQSSIFTGISTGPHPIRREGNRGQTFF